MIHFKSNEPFTDLKMARTKAPVNPTITHCPYSFLIPIKEEVDCVVNVPVHRPAVHGDENQTLDLFRSTVEIQAIHLAKGDYGHA